MNVFNSNNYTLVHLYDSPMYGITKTIGISGQDGYPDPFEPLPFPESDTMRYWYYGTRIHSYAIGLGLTAHFNTLVSGYLDNKLIGYVKNGDTTGTVLANATIDTTEPPANADYFSLQILENPAKSSLKLDIIMPDNKFGVLEIFNMNGQLVYADNQVSQQFGKTIPIDTYSPGFYCVRLRFKDQMVVRKVYCD